MELEPIPLSEAQLIGIGRLCYLWGRAEFVTDLAIYFLGDSVSSEVSFAITGSLRSFKAKQDILRNLAEIKLHGLPEKVHVINFVNTLGKLSERRNYAVHGYWLDDNAQSFKGAKDGKLQMSGSHFSPEKLEKLCLEVQECTNKFAPEISGLRVADRRRVLENRQRMREVLLGKLDKENRPDQDDNIQ